MYKLFVSIVDTIFPPSGDALLVRNLAPKDVSLLYAPFMKEDMFALSEFTNPSVRALIHEAKFHGNERAFHILGSLFDQVVQIPSLSFDMIIPIPLSAARKRERGYNQVHEVLKRTEISQRIGIAASVLMRTRNTRPQTELQREARLKNLSNAFRVKDPAAIVGKKILLVDDVLTTGATFHAAKAALSEHAPASVTCLAFAH